jgi:hypothetical protein
MLVANARKGIVDRIVVMIATGIMIVNVREVLHETVETEIEIETAEVARILVDGMVAIRAIEMVETIEDVTVSNNIVVVAEHLRNRDSLLRFSLFSNAKKRIDSTSLSSLNYMHSSGNRGGALIVTSHRIYLQ